MAFFHPTSSLTRTTCAAACTASDTTLSGLRRNNDSRTIRSSFHAAEHSQRTCEDQ